MNHRQVSKEQLEFIMSGNGKIRQRIAIIPGWLYPEILDAGTEEILWPDYLEKDDLVPAIQIATGPRIIIPRDATIVISENGDWNIEVWRTPIV